jgi:hypothetical protein
MAVLDVTEKARVYETLSSLNLAFAGIVQNLQTMQQSGTLTPKYTRLFQGFTQEVQAEINLEVLEAMDRVEMDDWARFGRVREKWEKYLRGQNRNRTRKQLN